MKIDLLESERLRIRPFTEGDLEHCRRFRREVFGLNESRGAARSAGSCWTLDSYRELANLGQPP